MVKQIKEAKQTSRTLVFTLNIVPTLKTENERCQAKRTHTMKKPKSEVAFKFNNSTTQLFATQQFAWITHTKCLRSEEQCNEQHIAPQFMNNTGH